MPVTGNNIDNNNISIRIATDGFSFCANGKKELHHFTESDDKYYRSMAICMCDNKIQSNAQNISVYFDAPLSTIVPQDIYSENYALPLLAFCYEQVKNKPEDYVLSANTVLGHNVVNLFAVPKELHNFLHGYFGQKQIFHAQTPFISRALRESKQRNDKEVWLSLSENSAYFLLCDKGNLLFSNRFKLRTDTDLLFYTGSVYDKFELSQADCPLYVCNEGSSTGEILKKHILNIFFLADDENN